jgi:hypothetical protein
MEMFTPTQGTNPQEHAKDPACGIFSSRPKLADLSRYLNISLTLRHPMEMFRTRKTVSDIGPEKKSRTPTPLPDKQPILMQDKD